MNDNKNEPFFLHPSSKRLNDYENLLLQDYQTPIRAWIEEGFNLFLKNAAMSVVYTVIAGLFFLLLSSFPFLSLIIYYPFTAGFIIVALHCFKKRQPQVKDYFMGFRYFLPLLVFCILSTVFIFFGVLLLILPGIYLAVSYIFAPFLIVEKRLDFWPAMEISRRKVQKNWFKIFVFALILLFINIIGSLPAFLGLFITIPLTTFMLCSAYRNIFMVAEINGSLKSPSVYR